MGNVLRSLALALVVVTPLVAEPELSTTASAPRRSGKLVAGIELRPSHLGNAGSFHTENWVQLGYRFGGGEQITYRQEFNTNLFNPRLPEGKGGMNAYLYDGSFRLKTPDMWKDDGGRSLGYEGRLYLPTFAYRRDAGMVAQLRNYFRFKQRLGSMVAVGFEEIPILHAYTQPGVVRTGGKAEANPIFENRMALTLEVTPFKKVKLFVPLFLSSVRHRAFARGAKNDNTWSQKLWIHPELTYEISPQATIGLAYYSENLLVQDGFTKGVTQVILNASL